MMHNIEVWFELVLAIILVITSAARLCFAPRLLEPTRGSLRVLMIIMQQLEYSNVLKSLYISDATRLSVDRT